MDEEKKAPDNTPIKNNKLDILNLFKPRFKETGKKIIKNFELDVNFADALNDMRVKALQKEKDEILISKSTDPKERFKDGIKQFNLSNEDIKKKAEQSAIICNIMFLITAVIISLIVINYPLHARIFSQIIFLMPSLSLIFLLLTLTARWGYYNYCIRNKAMMKFKTWVKTPQNWLPSATLTKVKMIVFIGLMSLSFHNTNAFADSSSSSCTSSSSSDVVGTFTLPCDQDVYKNMLEKIFPNVTPLGTPAITASGESSATSSDGATALADSFQAFLAVLMSLAMSGLAFHMISTLVSVAHEGSMISQRWSVVWSPIRIFFGAGALAPFIKGYCIAQVLVLYCALWGGSLANIMWTAYVDGLTSPSVQATSMPNLQGNFSKLASELACWESLNAYGDSSDTNLPTSLPQLALSGDSGSFASIDKSIYFKYQSSQEGGSDPIWALYSVDFGPLCGSMTVKVLTNGIYAKYGQSVKQAINTFITTNDQKMSTYAKASINGQQTTEQLSQVSSTLVSSYNTALNSWGSGISSLVSSINSEDGSMSSFVQDSKTYGWATAGVYYMNLSRMQERTNQIIEAGSEISAVPGNSMSDGYKIENSNLSGTMGGDAYKTLQQQISGVLSGENTTTQTVDSASSSLSSAAKGGNIDGLNVNTNTMFVTDSDNVLGKISNWIGTMLGKVFVLFFNVTGSNASSSYSTVSGSELQQMVEFGYNLIAVAEAIFLPIALIKMGVLGKAALIFGKTITEGPAGFISGLGESAVATALGKLVGPVISAIMGLCGVLLIAGIVHAYILPMMPYIHFSMFVMSMVIFVVEAMIAAPLWAFIHIKLNGQELIGHEQRTGYMLIFNLFLRAPLGMFGLFLSLSIFDVMIFFLKLTFYPAVYSGQDMTAATSAGSNNLGLIGTVVMLFMMTYLHFIIAMRSFELISELPNRVAKWFGAQAVETEHGIGKQLGSFMAGQVASQVAGKIMGAVGGAPGESKSGQNGGTASAYTTKDPSSPTGPNDGSSPGGASGGPSGPSGLGGGSTPSGSGSGGSSRSPSGTLKSTLSSSSGKNSIKQSIANKANTSGTPLSDDHQSAISNFVDQLGDDLNDESITDSDKEKMTTDSGIEERLTLANVPDVLRAHIKSALKGD